MKLSDYIEELQDVLAEQGDLTVVAFRMGEESSPTLDVVQPLWRGEFEWDPEPVLKIH